MRIAYFVNLYPKVSHSFIRREILALERRGLEVERFALRGWDEPLADAEDLRERERTRYVLADGLLPLAAAALAAFAASPLRFLRALRLALRGSRGAQRNLLYHLVYLAEACRLLRWLRAAGVRHVHAHFATNSAEVVMLARALGGPPYSFTMHSEEELASGGLEDKAGGAAFVVAVCTYGRSQLYRRLERALWPRLEVVHCGLEPAFYDVAPQPPAAAHRLVCVGRLSPEKGQLLLLEAAARLASAGTDFELELVGDGEMRAEIEACIGQLGLAGRVRLCGWQSAAEVRGRILQARALVLASFMEGLPVVLMEAMSLRRPVIATCVGGIVELVRPGENGWLVPAGCVDSLAQAMAECLAADSRQQREMGEAGRRRFLERHAIDPQAEKLAALFSAAAASGSPCTPRS